MFTKLLSPAMKFSRSTFIFSLWTHYRYLNQSIIIGRYQVSIRLKFSHLLREITQVNREMCRLVGLEQRLSEAKFRIYFGRDFSMVNLWRHRVREIQISEIVSETDKWTPNTCVCRCQLISIQIWVSMQMPSHD